MPVSELCRVERDIQRLKHVDNTCRTRFKERAQFVCFFSAKGSNTGASLRSLCELCTKTKSWATRSKNGRATSTRFNTRLEGFLASEYFSYCVIGSVWRNGVCGTRSPYEERLRNSLHRWNGNVLFLLGNGRRNVSVPFLFNHSYVSPAFVISWIFFSHPWRVPRDSVSLQCPPSFC